MREKKYEKLIDRALELRESGETSQSLAILSEIKDHIPNDDLTALVVVGSLFRKAKDFPNALICFQKAVISDPTHASASLGLFHTLWNMGRHDDGFAELERFLKISESEEHFKLIEEMRDA